MNSNTIKVALMLIGFLFVGLFLAQWIILLPQFYQVAAISVLLVIFLMIFFKPSVGLDIKLVFLVCLGYVAGGKGFAYVSPVEPFYIGEICLTLCMIGFLLRMWGQGWKFINFKILGISIIIVLLVFGGLRLMLIDFPRYGILAIRDSCMIYYALFTIFIILACRDDENYLALKKLLILMGPFCFIGAFLSFIGVTDKMIQAAPVLRNLFMPHPDIIIPTLTAAAATFFLKGVHERKFLCVLFAVLCMGLLACSKTAAIFCLIILFGSLIFFTGRRELIASAFFSALFLFVVVSVLVILQIRFEYTSAHLDTVGEVGSMELHDGGKNTTSWRLGWWRNIYEEVMEKNPLLGLGFGGDITTRFVEETYDVVLTEDESVRAGYARYPHNVFFTSLGRLGIIGCVLFTFMQIDVFRRMCRIMNKFFRQSNVDYSFFMAVSFVVAGIANSLVQMTYEGPYAAIPHWVALGFVYGYLQRLWKGLAV